MNKSLEDLRLELDQVDRMWIETMARRFALVRQIGEAKKTMAMQTHQPKRWHEVVDSRVVMAQLVGLDESFTRHVLNLIHQESLRIQENV